MRPDTSEEATIAIETISELVRCGLDLQPVMFDVGARVNAWFVVFCVNGSVLYLPADGDLAGIIFDIGEPVP